MTPNVLIGSHVSTRGGFHKAAARAREQGGRSFQYFPKNPRSLSLKSLNVEDAEACKTFCSEHKLKSIAHTPYPVNPATGISRGAEMYALTVASLRNDLDIAESCGSEGIIVHFGHVKTSDPLEGYKNIISCLNDVLKTWQGKAKILLENQAGDHGPMGTTMEEMVQIRSLASCPEKIGYCLDTCHAYASGLWNGKPDDEWMEKGHQLGYWSELGAVHLNDSKYPYGLMKDRHARVGQGHIGLEGLGWLTRQPPLQNIPVVLETEAGEDGTHRADIRLIRDWEQEASQK